MCLWTKDWALSMCFPIIAIFWWSAGMMTMWAFAWVNGNGMHLLSDVEKWCVQGISASRNTNKLSLGLKCVAFLTRGLQAWHRKLMEVRHDFELSATAKRCVEPCFKGLMPLTRGLSLFSKSCLFSVIFYINKIDCSLDSSLASC